MGPQHYSPTCEFGPVRHLEHKTPSGKCPGWQEGWPLDPAPDPEPTPAPAAPAEDPAPDPDPEPEEPAEPESPYAGRGYGTPDGYGTEQMGRETGGLASHSPGWSRVDPKTGRQYDWTAIKRRYVEGVKTDDTHVWPSLKQVAEHFNVAPQRVTDKSAQEGWVALRSKWQAQVETTRQQVRAAELAKEGLNLDNSALSAAKLGMQLCAFELQRIGQAAQAARSGGDTSAGKIDALEMTRLASAVDLWHKVGLRAIGDPETMRLELTGAGGAPIEISSELRRDDPTRIAGVLGVLQQAGLGELFGGTDVDAQVRMRELIASQSEDGS